MCPFSRLFLMLALACFVSCSHQPRPLVIALDSTALRLLDTAQVRLLAAIVEQFPNGSECSIALLERDSTEFLGMRRQRDTLVCIENRTTVFEIGSISKTMTATILAKLVFEGSLTLDTPIASLLPIRMNQRSLRGKDMTLLHLANHTSGLPKEPDDISTDWAIPQSPYRTYDSTKLYDYLAHRMALQSAPGEVRSYSNLGGGLLGHLLTLATKKSYEQLLSESICTPLGLQNTFTTIDSARRRTLVPGRDPFGRVVPNWELNVLVGGGGVKSSAEDMAKYLRAHLTDTTYFALTQRPTIQYTEHNTAGLGWAWYAHEDMKFVDATGGTGGYSCCVIFERTTQTGIVLLTNVSAFLASKGDYIVSLSRALYDPLTARKTLR